MIEKDKLIQIYKLSTRRIKLIIPKIYDRALHFVKQNFILSLANKLLIQGINLHIFKGIAHLNGN